MCRGGRPSPVKEGAQAACSRRREPKGSLAEVAQPLVVEVAMDIKDELLFDFSINLPRLLVSGETGIVDNVKKIVFITENSIVVDHGSRFSVMNGEQLRVKMIEEERMIVKGKILSVEFYSGKKGETNEK